MDKRKIIIQTVAAILLYVIISMVLEGAYSQEVLFEKAKLGLLFGLIYGIFLMARDKWKNKKR